MFGIGSSIYGVALVSHWILVLACLERDDFAAFERGQAASLRVVPPHGSFTHSPSVKLRILAFF